MIVLSVVETARLYLQLSGHNTGMWRMHKSSMTVTALALQAMWIRC